MNNGNQPLPRSEDCEKGVLCSALKAPARVMKECAVRINSKMFTPGNGILFDTISEWDKSDQPVDFVWLKKALKDRNQLEEIGGPEYLAALFEFVPTEANASWYIDVVREKWCEREAILLGHRLVDGADIGACYEQLKSLRDTVNQPQKPLVEFLSPSEIISYQPPAGIVLVGDNHITRGSVFVIGGAPGVGKSRSSVALAEAGATGYDWFGLKVHSRFKTLVIQNENGRFRLKREFSELDTELLDRYVRISAPPPCGLCFERSEFRDQLASILGTFSADVIIIDPWNAVTRDEKAKNYLETFDLIREVFPAGDDGPAIGIIAHTRKPQVGERTNGRALLNLLAGSYVLASVPRSIFVMQSASDDVTDDRVVWTCCKNNDGELGKRSAWKRCNGLFQAVQDFDWDAWQSDGKTAKLTFEIIPEIITETGGEIARDLLAKKLMEKDVKYRTAYDWISKAENKQLIKFHKGKDAFLVV